MATSTTSLAAIRDALVTAIKALTPTVSTSVTHAGDGFVFAKDREVADFREWCELNPGACFRSYAIEWETSEPMGGWDKLIQNTRTELSVIVAYPHMWALYGDDNAHDMADAIEGDLHQIKRVVGSSSSSYPAGAVPVEAGTIEQEAGDDVTFGVVRVPVEYWYDYAT